MKEMKFIKTRGSNHRVLQIINAITTGIPVLLEGPTGTSKTRSAIIACQVLGQHVISFNFSSQTSIEDLLGRMARNSDEWGGFAFKQGQYSEAYEKGYCLILDEINLAHETVLQCIEASIDSGALSIDIPGVGAKVIQMHPSFHIVATQNPLTGRFSQKRLHLSQKFLSRFQIINFKDIEKEELLEIANGLAEGMDQNIVSQFVQPLIEFHFQWQKQEIEENQVHVFTIREIAATIDSVKNGLSPYDAILLHYGCRYPKEKVKVIKERLNQLGLIQNQMIQRRLPFNYESLSNSNRVFFMSEILLSAFINSFHLLDSYHPILFVGPDGCGKTSFARWIGSLYSSIKNNSNLLNFNNLVGNMKTYICNPEMTISDIIGRYMPMKGTQTNEAPIRWICGPVIEAIRNGECLILDQIDTAPSTILERLNSLFDGLGTPNFMFTVQENPEETGVMVHQSFRIMATSSYKGLNDLSPAFLNRFSIIFIDDQLPDIFSNNYDQFFSVLAPQINTAAYEYQALHKAIQSHDHSMTVSKFSRIVRGYTSLKNAFPNADTKQVINFCVDIIISHTSSGSIKPPLIDDDLIDILLNSLNSREDNNKTSDTFYFKEAASTRKVMATLVACSVIGLHVILIGKTGLGKTAAATAFSHMTPFSSKSGSQMISFNGETQLEELFGFFTIENGNFTLHNGPLSSAMIDGQVFIADELNLAEQQIIQSLNVALEPQKGETIIIPVVGSTVTINSGFFFIGCQNDVTMYGRRPLPESFKKKLLVLEYPEPSHNDLLKLTISLSKQFELRVEEAEKTTDLIERMKNHMVFKSRPWTLREVRKLFRRTKFSKDQSSYIVGLTIHHHAAFLIRSSFRHESNISQQVADIVGSTFLLDNSKRLRLLNDINAKVMVICKEDILELKKGSLSLSIINTSLKNISDQLQSFWQMLFEVNITHQAEPLLLVGPSGFKTFLAQSISPLSPVVYLHSDSTTSSLIGQIALLDKYQAKLFLLDSLHGFVGRNDDKIEEDFDKVRMSLDAIIDDDLLKMKNIQNLVNSLSKVVPESFVQIIINVANQIINLDRVDSTHALFSDYSSLFKPGLVTKAIFQQNSLILKNIAQPSPTVLERFNELLSVNPTLTLFEDTSNTYTTTESKILYNFSQKFRIIGICLPHEKRGLSEAMLSRLTEISTPSYSEFEQQYVFQTIIENNLKHTSKSQINEYLNMLNIAFKIFKNRFDMNISFVQTIKIVQIASKWAQAHQNMNSSTIFGLAVMRCVGGQLATEQKAVLVKDLRNTVIELPEEFSKLFDFSINNKVSSGSTILSSLNPYLSFNPRDHMTQSLVSTLTGFSVDAPISLESSDSISKRKLDLIFTNSISDLIDLVISAASILQPLLIEGSNGCGKSSAVNFVANCVQANIIRISLSQSTTIEDLFGKVEPNTESDSLRFDFHETQFLHAIKANREDSHLTYWIIIEELHLASASVLDALGPVFSPQSDLVLLPNGDYINKGKYFIIGLLSLPLQHQAIVSSALYYKANEYTPSEFRDVCNFILERKGFGSDVSSSFCNKIQILNEIATSTHYHIPITPRDVFKFTKMMEASMNMLNPQHIMEMLFLGRFVDEESQINAREDLRFPSSPFVPEILVQNNSTLLSSGEVQLAINTKETKRQSEIKSLTVAQRQLFQFLSLAVEANIPIMVQGATASGKTHAIQLFADILGHSLRVIQLNSETTSASITGSYQPTKTLSESEFLSLSSSLNKIFLIKILPQNFLMMIRDNPADKWQPNEFRLLRDFLKQNISALSHDEKLYADEFIGLVDTSLQFFNHLTRKDSVFVESLLDGSWLLLDGIESAPPDLFDRLFPLLDEEPTLNLFERGEGYVYSRNNENPNRRISENFRLFMTYNPVDNHSVNNISPSFLSRCTIFSLQPIDNSIIDASLVISGLINNIKFQISDNNSDLAFRFAKIHLATKKLSKDMALNSSNTGRSFVRMCRSLSYAYIKQEASSGDRKISNKILLNQIKNHYCSSFPDPKDSFNKLKDVFLESVDKDVLDEIEKIQQTSSKHCISMVKMIDDFIPSLSPTNQWKEFSFRDFILHLLRLQLKDVQIVCEKINEISKILSNEQNNVSTLYAYQTSHLAAFKTLVIILREMKNAFNEIMANPAFQALSIDSEQLNIIPAFHPIIHKVNCLWFLVENKYFIPYIPEVMLDDDYAEKYAKLLYFIAHSYPFFKVASLFNLFSNLKMTIFDDNIQVHFFKIIGKLKDLSFSLFFKKNKSPKPNSVTFLCNSKAFRCFGLQIKVNHVSIVERNSAIGFSLESLVYFFENFIQNYLAMLNSSENSLNDSLLNQLRFNLVSINIDEIDTDNLANITLLLNNIWVDNKNSIKALEPINKVCGCLFRTDYCKHFFTGFLKNIFKITLSTLSTNNFDFFSKWVLWIVRFLAAFPIDINYIVKAKDQINENNNIFNMICSSIQSVKSIEEINNILSLLSSFPFQISSIDSKSYLKIQDLVEKLKEETVLISNKLNENYLIDLKDLQQKEIEMKYIRIKKEISDYINKKTSLSFAFQHLLNNIDIIEHTNENFVFLLSVFKSLANNQQNLNKKFHQFSWPSLSHDHMKAQPIDYLILKALIKYSIEIEKIEALRSPNWSSLCSFEHPDVLLNEFLLKRSISNDTIKMMASNARAELIKAIYEVGISQIGQNSLIVFFNKFKNRGMKCEDEWIPVVQELAAKYPADFMIKIPKYEPQDLLALLVNQTDRSPGILFQQKSNKNSSSLYENNINENNTSIDENHEKNEDDFLERIHKLYSSQFNKFMNCKKAIQDEFIGYVKKELSEKEYKGINPSIKFDEFISQIMNDLSIPSNIQGLGKIVHKCTKIADILLQERSVEFDFTDLININSKEYIDKNPAPGFYLAQFPEVGEYMALIENYSGNDYPLSLFGFRIVTRLNCIQIKLPTNFPTEKISHVVSDTIAELLSKKKITSFHNLIGFLLDYVPKNYESNHSDHFRKVVIQVLSRRPDQLISGLILDEICEILPSFIEILGNNNWENKVNEKDESTNPLLSFLRNPWKTILESLNMKFNNSLKEISKSFRETLTSISEGISNFSNTQFLQELIECTQKDENSLQIDFAQEMKNLAMLSSSHKEDKSVTEMMKHWKIYNANILNLLELRIQKISEIKDEEKLNNFNIFPEFVKSIQNNTFVMPSVSTIYLISIKNKAPKDSPVVSVTAQNVKSNKTYRISGHLTEGICLIQIPKDDSLSDYHIEKSKCTEIELIALKVDFSCFARDTFKLREMNENYSSFVSIFKRLQENTTKNKDLEIFAKMGKIQVYFNDETFPAYSQKINEISDKWEILSKSIFNIEEFKDTVSTIRNDLNVIRSFIPIHFKTETIRQPVTTQKKIEPLIVFTNAIEKQLDAINEMYPPSLIQQISKNLENKSEFNVMLKDINLMSNKIFPTLKKIINIDSLKKAKLLNDLLTPSIIVDDKNKAGLNINGITAEIGPIIAEIQVTPIQIRIVNFSNSLIKCVFIQDDQSLPIPTSENKVGYLMITIPINDLKLNNDKETFVTFKGKVYFSFLNSTNDSTFSSIPYSIKLQFIPPVLFFNMTEHYFAVKEGKADIVRYYCTAGSSISLKTIHLSNQKQNIGLQAIEKSNNTAQRPTIQCLLDVANIVFPKIQSSKNDDHFSANLKFIFSPKIQMQAGVDLYLNEPIFIVSVFSDDRRDFIEKNSIVNLGHMEREVYFCVGFHNTEKTPSIPTITVTSSDETIVAICNKPIGKVYKPNQVDLYIFSFSAKYIKKKIPKDIKIKGIISVEINGKLKTNDFSFNYQFTGIQVIDKKIKIHTNRNYPHCYFLKENTFIEYNDRIDISNLQTLLIVSPFSYAYYNNNGAHLMPKYDEVGEFDTLTGASSISLPQTEIIGINHEGIIVMANSNDFQQEDGIVKIFARLREYKDKPKPCFPLFGKDLKNKADDFDPNNQQTPFKAFQNFFLGFMKRNESELRLDCNDLNSLFSPDLMTDNSNFAYFIDFAGHIRNKINYSKSIEAISIFINCQDFITRFKINSAKMGKSQEWAFFCFIECIYAMIMQILTELEEREYYLDFPIPYKTLRDVQINQFNKARLNKEEISQSSAFMNNFLSMVEVNNQKEDSGCQEKQKEGYSISKIVKWNEISGFTASTNEEADSFNEKLNSFVTKIETVTITPSFALNSNNYNILDSVSFSPQISLNDTFKHFDLMLKATYQITFSLYSALSNPTGNSEALTEIITVLNKLLSVYIWARDETTKKYTPFKDFIDSYIPAFDSMYYRMKKAEVNLPDEYTPNTEIGNMSESSDFIILPKQPNISLENQPWSQIGLKKEIEKTKQMMAQQNNQNNVDLTTYHRRKGAGRRLNQRGNYESNDIEDDYYDDYYDNDNGNDANNVSGSKIRVRGDRRKHHRKNLNKRHIGPLSHETNEEDLEIIKRIKSRKVKTIVGNKNYNTTAYFDNDNMDVTNQELIEGLVSQAQAKNETKLEYQATDKTHIPANYNVQNNTSSRIEPFFEAAYKLSDVLINHSADNKDVLNNIDNVFTSILVDCSSSMNDSQKASLVVLSIAYANALTALRVPYSIVIFCDQDFQFILKKIEEPHDKIHFQRLLDCMSVRRRVSLMFDAIMMARSKITHPQRKNHALFVLTDGLCTTLHLYNEWRNIALNSGNLSISFFFLDILQLGVRESIVQPIWEMFASQMSKARSNCSLIFDQYESIYNNPDQFAGVFTANLSRFDTDAYSQINDNPMMKIIENIMPPIIVESIGEIPEQVLNKSFELIVTDIPIENRIFIDLCGYQEENDIIDNENINNNNNENTNLLNNVIEQNMVHSIDSFCVNFIEVFEEYKDFIRRLKLVSEHMVDQNALQEINSYLFVPNKPSQFSPSSNGSIFYFPGLIRFLLTHGQDTKIFLEKKSGLIRSYSIFIVIDCTISSFSSISLPHSLQTVFTLLLSLSKIDIPSLNIIITTDDGPVVLCHETSTLTSLAPCSPLWVALFGYMMKPHPKSQIVSALSTVLMMRMQQKTFSGVVFLLTDGNYGPNARKVIKQLTNNVEMYKTSILTIGIGSFPLNITKLTSKSIWAPDPKSLIKGISCCFGKESNELLNKIRSQFYNQSPPNTPLISKINSLVSAEELVFQDLHSELNKIIRKFKVFQDFYNKEVEGIDNAEANPEGTDFDLGKEMRYDGQCLLICMFWDSKLSENESKDITIDVLKNGTGRSPNRRHNNNNDDDIISVVRALTDFGMKVDISQDYTESIHKISSGTFSQVWVICGRGDGRIPSGGNANIVGEFVDCCIKFWQFGGALVWWTDNEPFVFELNIFLERVVFPNGLHTNLRIVGDHPGDTTLYAKSVSKEINEQGEQKIQLRSCFDKKRRIECDGYERALFNYNIVKMYEGKTVAYANSPSSIAPFQPFSISSDGGISALYYTSQLESSEGDIVIDCGFSKLFRELQKDGVYRYVRNIAVWMLSIEKREIKYGSIMDPLKFRPKQFYQNIHNFTQFVFKEYNIDHMIDVVFLIDGTGSMRFYVDAAKATCNSISKYCKNNYKANKFRFGSVIYRDKAIDPKDRNEFCPLNPQIKTLQKWLGNIICKGGGNDGPEDWYSGFQLLLKMNWGVGVKVVIHIADAPGHGTRFSGKKNPIDEKHDKLFPPLVREAAQMGCMFYCICGDRRAMRCFNETKDIFLKAGGKMYEIESTVGLNSNPEELARVIKEVAKKSVDDAVAIPADE